MTGRIQPRWDAAERETHGLEDWSAGRDADYWRRHIARHRALKRGVSREPYGERASSSLNPTGIEATASREVISGAMREWKRAA